MKRFILLFIISGLWIALLLAQNSEKIVSKEEAIKQTALNYIEGWYSGNPDRMEKALHKNLAKRGIFENPKTGEIRMQPATAKNMIGYTKVGAGKKPKDQWGIELKILDIYQNTATVKIVSVDFIDYAHIAKFEDGWKIVNVLWEPIKKEK